MPQPPTEPRVSQPASIAADADDEPDFPAYGGPAVLSHGFRPFFLAASLFAGMAVPLWIGFFSGGISPDLAYPPREWHVHEMLFGFLPAVMAGFLLTAVPNWTGRPPLRGGRLFLLVVLWLAGRLLMIRPWPSPLAAAAVDGSFLVVLAGFLWRQFAVSRTWGQAPVGLLVGLYAAANLFFHVLAVQGRPTDVPERMVLSLIILLLAVIGGRLTPTFTREFLAQARAAPLPPAFSPVDGLALVFALVSAVTWILLPDSAVAGTAWLLAGSLHMVRLVRWRGWMTVREPLVLVLHVGYGWLAVSMLLLGAAQLGMGLSPANAIHAVTTGAVGSMTLGIMTRASLGHTGRLKHAGPWTVAMYILVTCGALLRIFAPSTGASSGSTSVLLLLSGAGWSGAYLLFALRYGPLLLGPALDE